MKSKVTNIKQYIPSTKKSYDLFSIHSKGKNRRYGLGSLAKLNLSSITTKNFKSHDNINKLELNKINLIYGQNSAGKSSLLQSMLVTTENTDTLSYVSENLIPSLNFLSNTYDVGGFKHCIRDQNLRKTLTFGTEVSHDDGGSQSINFSFRNEKLTEISFDFKEFSLYGSEVGLIKGENRGEVKEKLIFNFSGSIGFKKINSKSSEAKKILDLHTADLSDRSRDMFDKSNYHILKSSSSSMEIDQTGFAIAESRNSDRKLKEITINYESLYLLIPDDASALPMVPGVLSEYIALYGIQRNKMIYAGENLASLSNFFDPKSLAKKFKALKINKDANLDLLTSSIIHSFCIQSHLAFTHIPPIRGIPGRGSIANNRIADPAVRYIDNVFSTKNKEVNKKDISKINKNLLKLGMDYKVGTSEYYQLGRKQNALVLKTLQANAELGFADVGKGVSQVLPIIVAAAIERHQNILIEQPEIHLHPRLQADVAEVLVESLTSNNNRFIVETHSDNLLLRLQKKVRKKELESNDISIYYLEKLANNKIQPVKISILEDGSLSQDFPEGFFDIALNEILD